VGNGNDARIVIRLHPERIRSEKGDRSRSSYRNSFHTSIPASSPLNDIMILTSFKIIERRCHEGESNDLW
jgi:hypothetical protein